MFAILVDGKSRTVSRQLEEHAARLLEIHRLEPEAVDNGRRLRSRRSYLVADVVLVGVVIDPPGKMMDGAGAPAAAPL